MGETSSVSTGEDRTRRDLSVRVDRGRGLVELTLRGKVCHETLMVAFNIFLEEPRDFHLRGFVWDVSAGDLSDLDLETLRMVLPLNTVASLAAGRIRSAAVVRDGPDKNLGLLWVNFGAAVDKIERAVFLDIEAARDWVAEVRDGGLPPDIETGWIS